MTNIQIEQIRPDLTWRIRQEAMYPGYPLESVKLDKDQEGMHFGLFAGNRLTSVISLFNEGTAFQFRKFATVPDAQGKGFGTAMLHYVIDYTNTMGATKLWCNARISASSFYEKFGFTKTLQTYRKHEIDFVIMELQLDNSLGA